MFELEDVSICDKLFAEVLLHTLQQVELHLYLWDYTPKPVLF